MCGHMCYLTNDGVLQGNQLRQLVQDSLNSYVAFFEQYRPATKPAVAKADGEQVRSHASCNRATRKHAVLRLDPVLWMITLDCLL